MGELSDFHKKVQMYLMKKNQELGELKLLTANITTENNSHVDDICKSMKNIFVSYDIPIAKNIAINNERGIQAYKYLLLNTNFESQGRLAEDIANGHLVDMCPPLSPFLFVQILWSLEYEKILVESLLYLPFDLCTEILQHVTKHINKLSYERLNEIMYQLIFYVHIKLYQLKEFGIQSAKIEDSIKNLLLGSEEFLLLLKDSKLCCLTKVSNLTKFERSGILLKKLLVVTKKCFQIKDNGIPISKDLEKLYSVTFGRESFVKCEDAPMQNAISELNGQLIELLLTKVKEVDCNVYLAWAEIYDQNNVMITMQRSIGIESYYFIDFISKDQVLSRAAHELTECLQFLSSKPYPTQPSFVLSIKELCDALGSGRNELMEELLTRYKEWDRTTIEFLDTNKTLLDSKGCSILLEYLIFILRQTTINSDDKEYCYHTVMNILSYQSMSDLYQIVMLYLMKYNGKNYLGTPETCEKFLKYIRCNANVRNGSVLKMVLLFILKDLKGILTILLKIAIGRLEYKHIMIAPLDILLLSSFLQIRDGNNEMLVTSILRTIVTENREWISKRFTDLMIVLLENSVLQLHELVNNVIIAYLLENTLIISNMNTVLNLMRMFHVKHTKDLYTKDLVTALAWRMSSIRKNLSISKFASSHILLLITKIVDKIKGEIVPLSIKESMVNRLELVMEPADRPHFTPFWQLRNIPCNKGVRFVIEDYERRCFCVLNRLKEDPKTPEKLRQSLMNFNLLREDFFHHLIIRATEEEYVMFFTDLVLTYYSLFNWSNEVEAYCNITRLTIEACCLYLEFPSIGAKDTFPFLIKNFTHYCKLFMTLRRISNYENVYDTIYDNLILNMNLLNESVKYSSYDWFFAECLLVSTENRTEDQTTRLLGHKLATLEQFGDQCHDSGIEPYIESDRPTPRKMINFYVAHEVISACLNVSAIDSNQCLEKLNMIFSTR
ncbi:uncharacterized protein LOC108630624 [Ceratina calcarata]|uniref:Uncharacterized protein LOC108630624 n=1 Tax=Ceratina calcarata TaxID=156304 RepID=A0AAJ7ND87_9HYME|nr:uncharacterized protein LOC108630624 [Ceratina calcarata]